MSCSKATTRHGTRTSGQRVVRAGSVDQASAASYWPSRPGLGHTGTSPSSDSQVLTTSESWMSAVGR